MCASVSSAVVQFPHLDAAKGDIPGGAGCQVAQYEPETRTGGQRGQRYLGLYQEQVPAGLGPGEAAPPAV